MPINCPVWLEACCEASCLINKGDGAEAECDHAGESHNHEWTPKPAAQLFNMHLNNVCEIHCGLVEGHSATVWLQCEPEDT